jgi:hypothetical protein
VESDHTRVGELLVGLSEVKVLGLDDEDDALIVVHVEQRWPRARRARCDAPAWVKDRPVVELVDLPCFWRSNRLVWHKHGWRCSSVA